MSIKNTATTNAQNDSWCEYNSNNKYNKTTNKQNDSENQTFSLFKTNCNIFPPFHKN